MSSELAVIDRTADDLVNQVALIQDVMARIMKKGEHYGEIPGCGPKPTLLQPGAQKLCLTFRLVPRYDVAVSDFPKGHREYRVKCTLVHQPTEKFAGDGMGSCSTLESKYRYRSEVVRDGTEVRKVPGEYWKDRDSLLLGGPQFSPKKMGKEWVVCQRVEHSDPADFYNTCLKMACKRAYVAATLATTAASDIFTQDVEDMDVGGGKSGSGDNSGVSGAVAPQDELQVVEGTLDKVWDHLSWTYGVCKGIEFSTKRPELAEDMKPLVGKQVRVTLKKVTYDSGKIKFRPQSIEVLASPNQSENKDPRDDETPCGSDE